MANFAYSQTIFQTMNRREMIKAGLGTAAMTILGGIPAIAKDKKDRKKILVIGAHPDDPETAAGGTICLLTKAGHDVACVYLTKGQASSSFTDRKVAADTRTKEAIAACAIMGSRYIFMDQEDGATEVSEKRRADMRELISKEKPDVVITHWPIDGHRDHAACGILVADAWRRLDHCFELYFFEVMTGVQTQLFHPTDWVDISSVRDLKYKACYCHESQHLEETMEEFHGPMEAFRGLECRCPAAEAFAHNTVPAKLV